MARRKVIVVFVHGWGVTSTKSYGHLPDRLRADAKNAGLNLVIHDVFLSKYISFHDEVLLPDISRAFNNAVEEQLSEVLKRGRRFVCITHSTGGPVVRDWWQRYYGTVRRSGACPMSHLIMLAPANFGSALAQLGKRRIGRLKSWFGGVEPGQGVLDWLELGSDGIWALNTPWISSSGRQIGADGIFPFVLTGQSIDRAFYDHLNTYTGEAGSDGVVRVAGANMNSNYLRLVQEKPQQRGDKRNGCEAPRLRLRKFETAPDTAFCILRGKSHSGPGMGIMRSIGKTAKDQATVETIETILQCMSVSSKAQYRSVVKDLAKCCVDRQSAERLEVDSRTFRMNAYFIHDRYSMVVFRLRDVEGHPVNDFDLVLTAGPGGNPDHLPKGFLADRQLNSVSPNTITFYFNYDLMVGSKKITDGDGRVIRAATRGAGALGMRIWPRPDHGFVRYLPCEIRATRGLLEKALRPNCTTLVDIQLQRVVSKNVFRADKVDPGAPARSFKRTPPGEEIV
ncbi:MAG: phospholipase [Gammaproteobacteria bacterium]|nr:phospholipase [Gammaproteobacteria bacterium]